MTARAWSVIAILALTIVAGATAWRRAEGNPPTVSAPAEVLVGREGATVAVSALDAEWGVRALTVTLRHAGGEAVLLDEALPGTLLRGYPEPATEERTVEIQPAALDLPEGNAFLDVEARDWSWRGWLAGNVTRVEVPVIVDRTPPGIAVETGLTYVKRGGSGSVVYTLSGDADRHGVRVGDVLYPGHPLGATGRHLAVFAVGRDATAPVKIRVVAEDRVGNAAEASWPARVQERGFDDVPIRLGQGFFDGKVASLATELGVGKVDHVADFQHINREVRAQNEAQIREVVGETTPEALFSGPFLQMKNSAVTSRFAEHRTYLFDGVEISEAVHYGYDLASTAGAPIEASNAGRVLFADALGIYGNCVILDHGFGVASLYGHLSSVAVSVGDRVERGQELGRSGATGLAGGDHLHFAILVGGTYVDPVEWWDPKWMRERIESRLGR